MQNIPFERTFVEDVLKRNNIPSVGSASIREVKKIIDDIEEKTNEKFVRMEMGIPGMGATSIGLDAQIKALKDGVASIYPDIYGTEELKKETAKFVKNFINLDIDDNCCVPTVGSMQGGFASFLTITKMNPNKQKVLFIDPGFPVQKLQCKVLGIETEHFDVYNFRGEKLKDKLESYLKSGDFACLIYSSPNNPAWFCFNDMELEIIGEVANKYDVTVIEDLAYFGMDFRKDYSQPGVAPYQPSVGHWAKKFVLLLSASKAFSYAGERIAVMVISKELFNYESENLNKFFSQKSFGKSLIFGALYALTSGTAHSPQYALSAIFHACNNGTFNFRDDLLIYREKAHRMKKALTENGFNIVYDKDMDVDIADGFYFTFSYPTMSGKEMLDELVYYGISAICLDITGSKEEGARACVSLVPMEMIDVFEERLKIFNKNHPIK
ncbi:MAG: pyridoxal phosphate-dependent aminotransferase [Bacteroidales bacterium]|jgi:aspartate/methionine/tyrosine aminotransferase|nr:pyridoxal phosphate-dependent aminotransferase [Bacteroidales bacterium]